MDNLERRSFSNQTGTLTKRPSTIKKLTAIPISLNKAFNDRIGENVPHLWNANRNFLELYQPYIKTEWRFYYFAYDTMKAKYKSLKEHISPDLQMFEKDFYEEIQRVDWFLNSNIHEIQRDLQTISDTCDFLNSSNHDDQKKKEELGRTVELFIRSIFEKCKACEKFYKLNHYVICKIAKKFEKLIESGKSKSCDDFTPWRDYPSNDLFNQKFSSRIDEIHYLTRKSVDTYSEKFRKTYPSLAYGELEFVKNKERESVRTRFYIGIKLGLIISTLAWLISDSYVTPNSLLFWTQPGLYVYTTVGNLLLFRFLWAVSIFVWSRYDVNYISVFNLSDTKPNLLLIINQTATQFVLYCVNLMFFFRANCYDSDIANTFLSYGCPSLLVIMCVFYELYEYRNFYNERLSRGVFTKEVVYDLVMAPFAKVTFRDNYAADTMTSFTKVISDFILASCWIVSGAFLKPGQTNSSFGSDYLSCTHHDMHIFIGCMQIYPQYIRIAQCARNYYKTGLTIHLYNIVKYLTTVVVISFGLVYSSYNTQYLVVVVISTLYKWWWDVVMDWGLFDILPTWKGGLAQFYCCSGAEDHSPHATNSNDSINSPGGTSANTSVNGSGKAAVSSRPAGSGMFLRQHLMYPSYTTYYVCIVMDLVLRFLWTVSLLPPTFFGTFVGPKLSFCLASLEIARRAMWGILRLEWEHLKFVKKGTVGFLQQRRKSLKPGMKLLDVINEYDDEPPFNYAAAGNRNKPQPDGLSPRGGKVGPSAAGDDMDLALEMQLYHQSPHSKDFSHINGSIMGSSIHGGSIHQHLSDMVSEFESLETDRSADRIPHSNHLYDNSTAADGKSSLYF